MASAASNGSGGGGGTSADPAKYLTGSMVSQMLKPPSEKNHVGVGTRDGVGGGATVGIKTPSQHITSNHYSAPAEQQRVTSPNHLNYQLGGYDDYASATTGRSVRIFSGEAAQQPQQQPPRNSLRSTASTSSHRQKVFNRRERVCGENYINVDRFFLVAMPILFLIFNVAYWLYFGGHLLIQEAGPIEKY